MTSPAACLGPHTTIREASQKMRDLDVGSMVCCEDDGRPVGIVTDRDITVRATAEGKDPNTCRVAEVMSRGVVTVEQDSTVKDAEKLMEERQIRRLVVLEGDRAVGVVALADIVGADRAMTGRIVERVTEPASGYIRH